MIRRMLCMAGLLGAGGVFLAATEAPVATSQPAAVAAPAFWQWAPTPPMGWNSWDCFGTSVTEAQTLANADYMAAKLKSHGWNIITIDIQWYEPKAKGLDYRKNAVLEMDANGRLLPAPNRFPSTAATHSFKAVADEIHARGLKFGLHLLRGIPRQAVKQNTPILGTRYHAADIANVKDTCKWNPDMYGVDMSKPGAQAYYDSVFAQLAAWQIDFVKVDDLSRPYHQPEIEAIRRAIDKTGRRIVLSTSPGDTPLADGANIEMNANMWRISDDFWDNWHSLKEQFSRLNAWTPYRGAGHYPDADMLPFGNIRAFEKNGWTHFTHDEQRTVMTLWSIARSPLILGGNLPRNDAFTEKLLTNDAVLAVDQHSANNHQVSVKAGGDELIVWEADVPGSSDKYVALFNAREYPVDPNAPRPTTVPATTRRGRRGRGRAPAPATMPGKEAVVSISLHDLGITQPAVTVRDLWSGNDLGRENDVRATLSPHQSALYRITPAQ